MFCLTTRAEPKENTAVNELPKVALRDFTNLQKDLQRTESAVWNCEFTHGHSYDSGSSSLVILCISHCSINGVKFEEI